MKIKIDTTDVDVRLQKQTATMTLSGRCLARLKTCLTVNLISDKYLRIRNQNWTEHETIYMFKINITSPPPKKKKPTKNTSLEKDHATLT